MIASYERDGTLVVTSGERVLLRAHAEVLLSDGSRRSSRDGPASRLSYEVVRHGAGLMVQLRFGNAGPDAVRVEQLRVLVAPDGFQSAPLARLRVQESGWQSWSRATPPAPFTPNAEVAAPPIRGPWLPHRHVDSQVEPWLTVLHLDDSEPNEHVLLGFSRAVEQLGTIEVAPSVSAGGHRLLAAVELDGIELRPGGDVVTEPLLVLGGTLDEVLTEYARTVAKQMHARPPDDVLTGWCSWYELYTSVRAVDIDRNLAQLAERRAQIPLDVVQLDDGYQHAVGDWLEVNDKFPLGLAELAANVRSRGFKPGLWLAPFLLSARSHTFAAHPDWVVRTETGEPLVAIENWGAPHYAVDTTHPDALAWLQEVVRIVGDEWGFEYLKLDFLYAAAMRGRRHDPAVTAIVAYRRGLAAVRAAAGERFILGCGAPLLPSVGLVDGMRIGTDVAPTWGTEGNSDGPALRHATRATLARGWMHGVWWTNDPDCVVIRARGSDLSLDEIHAWAAVVALSGGMVFVGDDLVEISAERLALLARLLPPTGQAATTAPPLAALMPERLRLHVERPWASWDIVAIANWSDAPATRVFDPRSVGLASVNPYHLFDLWRGEYLGRRRGPFDLGLLPPHTLRLLSVHLDLGRPQTIGSTGHLFGEAMDLATEYWSLGLHELTVQPSTAGVPGRRGELFVYDPHGPLRRVPFSQATDGPTTLRFDPLG